MIHRVILGIAAFGAGLLLAPDKLPAIEDLPIREIVIREEIHIPLDIQLSDLPQAWQDLAKCESNGRLNAVSGTRKQFQGAFQIEYPRTWIAHGGDSGTPPKKATLREQFHVALHIYADRGAKPWPYCGKFLKAEYGR